MQRLIVLLGLALAALTWSTLTLAQTAGSLADGQQKAADGDIKGALAIYQGLTEAQPESYEAFAHLGGMLFGLVLLMIWKRKRY